MWRGRNEFLDQHAVVAERGLGPALALTMAAASSPANAPRAAAAAAAGGGLDQNRKADLSVAFARVASSWASP
jgi:hypothetical protein